MREFPSYKGLVSDVDAHIAFLRVVCHEVDNLPDGVGLSAQLSQSIAVKGAPFSQAPYMMALETMSDGWDIDALPDEKKVQIIQLSTLIRSVDPAFDLPHCTYGFEWVRKDLDQRGVKYDEVPACGEFISESPTP